MLKRWWALLLFLSVTFSYAGKPVPKSQELFALYWSSESGWDTQLQLRNNLPLQPLTVTPVLRLASGQEVSLTAVTIPANDSLSISTSQALLERAPELLTQPGCYGSVLFRFNSVATRALHATSVLMLGGAPISIPIRADSASQPGKSPRTIEGIWWHPYSSLNDILVISNVSDRKISGSLSLFDATGKRWSNLLALGSHQTTRIMFNDLLPKSGLSGGFGGFSISSNSGQSGFEAVHYMYDEPGKFSVPLEVFTRDPLATIRERTGNEAKEWTIRAPMLALRNPDPALGLSSKTVLNPTILVRNTTAKTISAEITLNWRGDSAKGQAKLPTIQLDAYATQQLQIGAMQSLLQIPDKAHWALVSVTTTAQPDDLIAIASSRDPSGRYGAETNFVGGAGGRFGGGEFRADTNHNAITAITNVGRAPTDALLTLHYDGGKQKYELQQTIAPGDQMWVNLSQLIRDHVPDRKGNLLPVDLKSATYDLRDLTPGDHNLSAGSLVLDNTFGFSAAPPPCYDCCEGIVPSSPAFLLDPLVMQLGDIEALAIDGVNSCSGVVGDITDDFTSWGSDEPSVVTVTSKQAKAIGPGYTYVYANGDIPVNDGCGCIFKQAQPSTPTTVQVPTASVVVSQTDSHANTSCPSGQAGWYRQVLKAVVDQNGNPIELVGQNLDETVTITSPNQLNLKNPQTGTAVTDPNGQFTDTFFDCSALCPGAGQTDASQTISDILPNGSGPYNLAPNTLVYTCSSITVNGK